MKWRPDLHLSFLLVLAAACLPDKAAVPVPPEFPPRIAIEEIADAGATITSLTNAGDGSGRLFLTTRGGQILIIRNGILLPVPFLDLTERVDSASIEQGLLGLAFDPDYETNGVFYVYYTSRESDNDTIVARYQVSPDRDRGDYDSEEVILFVEQPANNHNAGELLFGADGFLYVALGDGGPGKDLPGYAQNTNVLLGKILRLDVRGQETYAIPPDNPFVGQDGARPEIWAYGLRNPWRFTFDVNGDFYLGDVGQENYEELNFVAGPAPGGLNFGWNVKEGSHCFKPATGCVAAGMVEPIYDYQHGEDGCSITGGYVYRGAAHPEWAGTYFFSDFCTGDIKAARLGPDGQWEIVSALDTELAVVSFGLDEAGEMYVLDLMGKVYSIVDAPEPAAP